MLTLHIAETRVGLALVFVLALAPPGPGVVIEASGGPRGVSGATYPPAISR